MIAVPDGTVSSPYAGAAVVATAATTEASPAAQTTAGAVRASAASLDASGGSGVNGAAPVLLALLGVAVVLLALAAIPGSALRSPVLAGAIVRHRTELSLVGIAILASAAIGLAVALVAG